MKDINKVLAKAHFKCICFFKWCKETFLQKHVSMKLLEVSLSCLHFSLMFSGVVSPDLYRHVEEENPLPIPQHSQLFICLSVMLLKAASRRFSPVFVLSLPVSYGILTPMVNWPQGQFTYDILTPGSKYHIVFWPQGQFFAIVFWTPSW